jgi:hypothetical protein
MDSTAPSAMVFLTNQCQLALASRLIAAFGWGSPPGVVQEIRLQWPRSGEGWRSHVSQNLILANLAQQQVDCRQS